MDVLLPRRQNGSFASMVVTLLEGDTMKVRHRNSGQRRRAVIPLIWALVLAFVSPEFCGDARAVDAKITPEQASQVALKVVPGKDTDVSIEKKRGRNVYVIEILAEKNGAEIDVLVDIESGKVLGTDR